ncbi:hypothetical protein PV04_06342 [Phialophora macrospora]|uniref:BD-FAE-like domain-containing protein n=1 Tax=Phialophora macrospora TaxID=1851006 RepID=A0A0D2CPJ0_9EURO|nr:hypothetical protein PV04_06342 [Phialophora macrospora]
MDQLPPLGRSVWEVIPKTSEIYGALLSGTSKDAILATRIEVASYGPDPRQTLDVYSSSASAPVLVFLYGGAWAEGDRVIDRVPDGLVYRNLGYYFAGKQGFETIIPDYRLVKHGAKYPSGAEDLALVLEYIENRYGRGRPVFVLGNSAGGVNVMSWLLGDAFEGSRRRSNVAGIVSLGALMDFDALPPPLPDVLTQYFEVDDSSKSPSGTTTLSGAERPVETHSPAGTVDSLERAGSRLHRPVKPRFYRRIEKEWHPDRRQRDNGSQSYQPTHVSWNWTACRGGMGCISCGLDQEASNQVKFMPLMVL